MGRIFETRKHTMFARYDRMAKQFTRVSKDIIIAVRAGGPNADHNPALRRCLQNARACNMPKDKVENAIKRALGADTSDYAEVIYEGYAPHGIAVLVVTATDNPTRTIANVRVAFNKNGGNVGTTGSVNYLFKKMGTFRLNPEGIDAEELELELIDHGLEEMGESTGEKGEPLLIVRCEFTAFGELQTALEDRKLKVVSSAIEYLPGTPMELPQEQADDVLKLVARLEGDDDVQDVFHTLG